MALEYSKYPLNNYSEPICKQTKTQLIIYYCLEKSSFKNNTEMLKIIILHRSSDYER